MLFFRLPFDDKFYTTDRNTEKSFVSFFSFKGSENLRFEGDLKAISELDFQNENLEVNLLNPSEQIQYETKTSYCEKIKKAIDFVKEKKIPKVVISRRIPVDFNEINLKQSFLNLCKAYPNAFVYVFSKNNQCWIGAFSEVLGIFNKNTGEFQTMSLAGTLPVAESWTEKEIGEQKPVTDYISKILNKYSKEISVSETHEHISGNIKHLRTDFSAKIDSENLENLIQELHPTPAVCGIPKELCTEVIQELEQLPREFYAGYSKIETEDEISFFVNLRCGKICKNRAEIFAGGGITALSNPEKEWTETELKSQSVIKNLAIS